RAENITTLVKGNQTIRVYFRSPNIPVISGDTVYDVTRYSLHKWTTTTFGSYWESMDEKEVEGGDPPIYTTTESSGTTWEHAQPGISIVKSNAGWSLTPVNSSGSGLYDQLKV
ncbi:MAG: hypothetical protein ACFFB3_00320, partial [Candidatus Hodarchaeota archaeon]